MTMCHPRVICHLGLLICFFTIVHGKALDRKTSCPDGFDERLISHPGTETVQKRCCHPISLCGPGREVVDCSVDYGEDQCQACPKGLVQPKTSSSSSRWKCFKPSLVCAEEAVEREVAGTRSCQCDAERGYCGLPTNCKKKEQQCEPGFFLHHETCHCVAGVTSSTSKPVPVMSGPLMTTTPYSALPASENHQDVRGPASANSHAWIPGLIFGILGILLLLLGIILIIISRSRHYQGFTIIYKIIGIFNIGLNRATESHDNRTYARPATPEDEESDETVPKSASPICEEENRARQEEEGPGDNPMKPMLEQPSDCVPINPSV